MLFVWQRHETDAKWWTAKRGQRSVIAQNPISEKETQLEKAVHAASVLDGQLQTVRGLESGVLVRGQNAAAVESRHG